MKTGLLLPFFLMLLATCGAAPHTREEHPPGAVLEFSEDKGFRLSPAAIHTLGIETKTLQKAALTEIPASARVYYQAEIGVYRLREGWFQLIPLDAPGELRPGDTIVIRGAGFLRVTDMSLFGEGPSGHHH